jgi:glucose-1-phosphate cytidylyltransferase
MRDGEELVVEPFQRLIQQHQLLAYKYEGYWGCMDTFKDRQQLEDLYTRGEAPWEVWKRSKSQRDGVAWEEWKAKKKKAAIKHA